jgi:hypothetical protein
MSSPPDTVPPGPSTDGRPAGAVQQLAPPYLPGYPPPRPDRVGRLAGRLRGSPVWVAPAAALTCMAGAAAFTIANDPAGAGAGEPPSCLLKYTTGFDCPGCGGTRAAWYLLHGDVPAAARHHLIFVFAVPFLLWMYVAWAGRRMFGWHLPQLRVGPTTLGVFLGVWGLWSVLRNLPWAPFTWFFV